MHNKILLAFLLISMSHLSYAQQLLRGQIIDKNTGDPVVEAHISSTSGTIAVSDSSGLFELNRIKPGSSIRITHVAYGIIEYQINTIPRGILVIQTEPNISNIDEVQISGERLRILTQKDPFSIQEFAIEAGVIWFIGHINNQANLQRLFLANLYGDTICSIPIKRAESLYQDVFQNVHLVLKDSVYQLFHPGGDQIELLYPVEKTRFFSIFSEIEAAFNYRLVYSKLSRRGSSRQVYYIQEDDPQSYFLADMRDTLEELRKWQTQKVDNLMRGYGIRELTNMWSAVRRYSKKGSKFQEVIDNTVPHEIFSVGEELFILNYLKDSLLQYSKKGKFKQAIAIDFHKEERLGGIDYKELDFLTDPVSKKVYLLERYISRWVLSPLDMNTGSTKPMVHLPDFPGMDGICVYNNAVYFTYHEKHHPYYTRLYRYQL